MKKILKSPSNLVRRVLSKTSNTSRSSSHEHKTRSKKSNLMSEEQQIGAEIGALKVQIENLKAAIDSLRNESEKKEVAIANIAREKAKITMDLLKQRRSNDNLQKQLEEERQFYYKEKEMYCQEMNQFKRLKQVLSSASTNKDNPVALELCKKDMEKMKQTLNQTLEANYNLSIKFLRMKNTKTCLKTELKTMHLEHEKLANDYKAKILSLSEELNDLIQERLNTPISCSSKKYLHLVKQNSCLVYENLCLQLEVDNLHLRYEKLKLDKIKSETNNRLKYIKHDKTRPKSPKRTSEKDHKRVRIKEERPEKLQKDLTSVPSTSQGRSAAYSNSSVPSTSQQKFVQQTSNEQILKIFERNQLPGIPDIQILNDFESPGPSHAVHKGPPQIPSVQENNKLEQGYKNREVLMKRVLEKPNSKLDLFQVSNLSSKTSVGISSSLVRVRSSPDIVRTSSASIFNS